MQYKRKHRLSAALMAGAMCCTMIPAVSAGEIIAPETAQTETLDPDAAVLYADLPDAPAGSYIGSEGLPVATGQTKSVCRCGRTVSWSRIAVLTRTP